MGPPPNDDLDLQIIWLAAVERYGRNVKCFCFWENTGFPIVFPTGEYGQERLTCGRACSLPFRA